MPRTFGLDEMDHRIFIILCCLITGPLLFACGSEGDDSNGTPCAHGTFSVEDECVPMSVCQPGEHVLVEATESSDRECAPCESGYSTEVNADACTEWTDCRAGEYVSMQGDSKQDRRCSSCPAHSHSLETNANECRVDLSDFRVLSAGRFNACGIRASDGTAWCWGSNDHGQSRPPVGVQFESLSAGFYHVCGVAGSIEQEVLCWGRSLDGQSTPPSGVAFESLSAGGVHTCGIRGSDGEVECWGSSLYGQSSPPAGTVFASVSAGGMHTCAIRASDRTIECWGSDEHGQSHAPVGSVFESVSAGGMHTCAVRADDGFAECWGSDEYGQSSPPAGIVFESLTAGGMHTCGVRASDREVMCWGDDIDGQSTAPSGVSFEHVAAGGYHSCGIRAGDGETLCWGADDEGQSIYTPPALLLVVDSLLDSEEIPGDTRTLRAAIESLSHGGMIVFDEGLDAGTIELGRVARENSILKGEVFEMGQYLGYRERNYGPSALHADKTLTIDASNLPGGIHLHWTGGASTPARVLAVHGDLTLRNIKITGGYSVGLPLDDSSNQPYTLARGGGLAVWGHAVLDRCTVAGNTVVGDLDAAQDRGAFGGGIYVDLLTMEDSIVSGNRVSGYGAAGGGIYSVGGVGFALGDTVIRRSAITGNRIEGLHTYGGGVYSDGGGRGESRAIHLDNSTVARNVVRPHPDISIPEDPADFPAWYGFYYRGGGIYMSNGYMRITSCTIAENSVMGREHPFSGRPNVGGGGIGATIGDAHTVEEIRLRHSIVVGNELNGVVEDVFTGSLVHFISDGYNLVGHIDFRQILVPVPRWFSLSRRHWPKIGDEYGLTAEQVLDIDGAVRHDDIESVGADAGEMAVLWYPVHGNARNAIPAESYSVTRILVEDSNQYGFGLPGRVLEGLRGRYADELGEDFGQEFSEHLLGAAFFGPGETWPSNAENTDWIDFWKELDAEIRERLHPGGLVSDFWVGLLNEDSQLRWRAFAYDVSLNAIDQHGESRPFGSHGDIGAVEMGQR